MPPPPPPLQPGMQPYPGYPGPMGYHMGYPMVPVMAPPPGQPFMGPGHPPPGYPGPRGPSVRPTDPPVYSYLVQRGYQPLDPDMTSSANTSHSRTSLDELDRNAAASGVEYMRRWNTVQWNL
jgi:hypothetical protein